MALSQESPLEVHVNGEPHALSGGTTVAGLLASLDMAERRLAVAVNRVVIPRSRYDAHVLAPGDRVEILEAVGGG